MPEEQKNKNTVPEQKQLDPETEFREEARQRRESMLKRTASEREVLRKSIGLYHRVKTEADRAFIREEIVSVHKRATEDLARWKKSPLSATDEGLAVLIRAQEALLPKYTAAMGLTMPQSPEAQKLLAQTVDAMQTIDLVGEDYIVEERANGLPQRTAGEMLTYLQAQIPFVTVAESPAVRSEYERTYPTWKNIMLAKAQALFSPNGDYSLILAASSEFKQDKQLASLREFCEKQATRYEAGCEKSIDPNKLGQFKAEASSMATVEDALEWASVAATEFRHYVAGNPQLRAFVDAERIKRTPGGDIAMAQKILATTHVLSPAEIRAVSISRMKDRVDEGTFKKWETDWTDIENPKSRGAIARTRFKQLKERMKYAPDSDLLKTSEARARALMKEFSAACVTDDIEKIPAAMVDAERIIGQLDQVFNECDWLLGEQARHVEETAERDGKALLKAQAEAQAAVLAKEVESRGRFEVPENTNIYLLNASGAQVASFAIRGGNFWRLDQFGRSFGTATKKGSMWECVITPNSCASVRIGEGTSARTIDFTGKTVRAPEPPKSVPVAPVTPSLPKIEATPTPIKPVPETVIPSRTVPSTATPTPKSIPTTPTPTPKSMNVQPPVSQPVPETVETQRRNGFSVRAGERIYLQLPGRGEEYIYVNGTNTWPQYGSLEYRNNEYMFVPNASFNGNIRIWNGVNWRTPDSVSVSKNEEPMPPPSAKVEKKETVKKIESKEKDRYEHVARRYAEVIGKDRLKFSGTPEWQAYDQQFQQYLTGLVKHLGYFPEDPSVDWKFLMIPAAEAKQLNVRPRSTEYNTVAKQRVNTILDDMEALINRYEKEFKQPSTEVERTSISEAPAVTDAVTALNEIQVFKDAIKEKGGELAKRFDALDQSYTTIYSKHYQKDPVFALLALSHWRDAAKKFAEVDPTKIKTGGSSIFNLSALNAFGIKKDDDVAVRKFVLEQAAGNPFAIDPSVENIEGALRLLQYSKEFNGPDSIFGTADDDPDEPRGKNAQRLIENLQKVLQTKSELGLKPAELATGRALHTGIPRELSPRMAAWVLAAFNAPEPLKGLPDDVILFVEKNDKKSASPTEVAKPEEKAQPKEKKEDGGLLGKGLGLFGLGGKKKTEEVKTDEELVTPFVQLGEASDEIAPEKPKISNEGISIDSKTRRIRVPTNDSFTVSYDPNPNNIPEMKLNAETPDVFGSGLNVKRDGDVWLIQIKKGYENAITITRDADGFALKVDIIKPEDIQPKPTPTIESTEKVSEGKLVEITSEDAFIKEVVQSKIPVIIDLYTTWCGPCRDMIPNLETVASSDKARVKIAKIDAEAYASIVNKYLGAPTGYPSFAVYKNGKLHSAPIAGFRSEAKLRELIPPMDANETAGR